MADYLAPTPGEAAFLDQLIDRRLLVPTGEPGVYGRGHQFELVREGSMRWSPASPLRTPPNGCGSRLSCLAASSRRAAT